jgi:hypothetical protein
MRKFFYFSLGLLGLILVTFRWVKNGKVMMGIRNYFVMVGMGFGWMLEEEWLS